MQTLFPEYLTIQNLHAIQADRTDPHPLGFNQTARGMMTYLNTGQPIGFLAFVEFIPEGGIRGRHTHQYKQESFYVVSGTLQGRYWLEDETQAETYIHPTGTLLTIQPGLFHVFECVGGPALACEFSPQGNDSDDYCFPES